MALDEQQSSIARELVRNPRLSDNGIARKTGIPVTTVNRKRKEMEQKGILFYFTMLNQGPSGTGRFAEVHFYRILFKLGISESMLVKEMQKERENGAEYSRRIHSSLLGEHNGHLVAGFIFEGKNDREISEFFNTRMVPFFITAFGDGCITEVLTYRMNSITRMLHNYLPGVNMDHGTMKQDWPDELINVE